MPAARSPFLDQVLAKLFERTVQIKSQCSQHITEAVDRTLETVPALTLSLALVCFGRPHGQMPGA